MVAPEEMNRIFAIGLSEALATTMFALALVLFGLLLALVGGVRLALRGDSDLRPAAARASFVVEPNPHPAA